MKKFFILLLLSVAFNTEIASQTLHAIIFANTKSPGNPNNPRDNGIGPSVTVDFERMGIEMTSIASFVGYNLKKYYYYGTPQRFSKSSLISVLNSLSCNSEDIVFFYYSGHGGRYENEGNEYPEMILSVPYGQASLNDLYSLYDVYKTIKKKSPRLTIVLGDLCNSTFEGAYKSNNSNKGASVRSSSVCDVYKNLFLGVKGGLIATSSKPGHTSGCAKFTDGSEAGGNFTASFLQCLGDYVSKGSNVSWDKLLQDTRKLTSEISSYDEQGEKQYPVYSTKDLVKVAVPTTTTTNSNTSTSSDDAQTTYKDNMADALSSIANSNNSMISRIKGIQPTIKRFFSSPNVRIQVVGRDSKTIVNTTFANKYLDYLSIATNIEKIMVLDEKKDDKGMTIYLKVHEMHRQ